MRWPWTSRTGLAAGYSGPPDPLYSALCSASVSRSSSDFVLPLEALAHRATTIVRFDVESDEQRHLASAVEQTWAELMQRATDLHIDGFQRIELPQGRNGLLTPGFLLTIPFVDSMPDEVLGGKETHVVCLWAEFASRSAGTVELHFRAVGVAPGGIYQLTMQNSTSGLFKNHWAALLATSLRSFLETFGAKATCQGLFPALDGGTERLPLDDGDMTLQRFDELLRKHGKTKHPDTMLTHRVIGTDPRSFLIESEGHLTSGSRRRFHSGSIPIRAANVAYTNAVRWAADYVLLLVFRQPVEFRSTNIDSIWNWQESTVSLALPFYEIPCESLEQADLLKRAFDQISPNVAVGGSHSAQRTDSPPTQGSQARKVEEPD